jgi:hypothetical protein
MNFILIASILGKKINYDFRKNIKFSNFFYIFFKAFLSNSCESCFRRVQKAEKCYTCNNCNNNSVESVTHCSEMVILGKYPENTEYSCQVKKFKFSKLSGSTNTVFIRN